MLKKYKGPQKSPIAVAEKESSSSSAKPKKTDKADTK